MNEYSFDVSFYVNKYTTQLNLIETLNKIIKKYPTVLWYASDFGGKSKTINNGYKVYDSTDLLKVFKEICDVKHLFIDFVNSGEDCERIYASKNCIKQMSKEAKIRLNNKLLNLTANDEQIIELLTRINKYEL